MSLQNYGKVEKWKIFQLTVGFNTGKIKCTAAVPLDNLYEFESNIYNSEI